MQHKDKTWLVYEFIRLISIFYNFKIFSLYKIYLISQYASVMIALHFNLCFQQNLRFWYANTIYHLSHSFILKSLKNILFLIFYKYLHGFLLLSVICAFCLKVMLEYYIERQCLLKCTRQILMHAREYLSLIPYYFDVRDNYPPQQKNKQTQILSK